MTPNKQFLLVAGVSLVVSTAALATLPGGGPAELWTETEIAKETGSVASSITGFGTSFGAALQQKFEMLISAVAIATKQEALAANQVAEANRTSAMQFANAAKAQRLNDSAVKAWLDYSPRTGHGYNPCGTIAKNQSMDMAFDGLPGAAEARMGTLTVSPGRMVASTPAALQQRLATHRKLFCTPAESAAGLCSTSSIPGGDTNASLFFTGVAPGSLQAKARQSYMEHVLGAPDQAVAPSAGQSAAGAAYLVAKGRKDSLLSIPAYSLAMIDQANTQSPQYGNQSANDMLKLRVNAYFGGAEAQDWSRALATQGTRGLLVEQARMNGLEAWIHERQYEQNQRIEANLAALLLASSDRMKGSVDEMYRRAVAVQVTGAMK